MDRLMEALSDLVHMHLLMALWTSSDLVHMDLLMALWPSWLYGPPQVCDAYPYGQGLYEKVHQAFEWLPLAAIVGGAVAVMHGGVGDGSWALDDLRDVKRPLQEDDDSEIAQQALWSDPSDSDAEMMNGVHPNERGDDIKTFGPDVSAKWCYANHVQLLVVRCGISTLGHRQAHSCPIAASSEVETRYCSAPISTCAKASSSCTVDD